MSFSQEVKEELSKIDNLANKEEVKYEFLGYITSNNITENENYIKYVTENDYNIDRFTKVIRNVGIENFDIKINGKVFVVEMEKKQYNKYYQNIKELKNKFFGDTSSKNSQKNEDTNQLNLKKAFMRGIFMGAGSINNPEKKYHLECGIKNTQEIEKIVKMMLKNNINLKGGKNIIYMKEGEEISKFLAFLGAAKSVLKFEEIRVERHMNNKINRLVNCKSANLNKVLNASVEQVDAIRKLKQDGGFEKLDENLKEIAELRLANPDMPLVELGKMLSKPVGKSGVNYRLKKIIDIAKST